MKSSFKNMVIVLTATAAVMGAVLALVHEVTAEPVHQAEINAKNEALAMVLPEFDNDPSATMQTLTVDGESRPVQIYTGKKGDDVCGIAVESYTSEGFSGDIIVMVGFDTEGKLTGYKVLQHAETPGLGAKADDWFRDPTDSRSVIGTSSDIALKKDNGEIDGITAATITSRAFVDAVNRARKAFNQTNAKS